ncbi:MAG: chromosome segregation protein SMC [Clostridia bacterium]|nr:chromosome segregation protein SMC [Clostridia bacterium]
MYLKRLEMQGFKSFADKTTLEFMPGITSVIGPNGSGKSNIVDCIKWILGEQSMKELRGGKSSDIIFAGTQSRKSLGYAEASLIFDNSDGALPIEYTEVTVTRKIYRSGETGYYINKVPCRLKDILELFMDTGIGRDGYSIIGQGKIDQILSNKSEDRRNVFEEAAGIVKYKTRKEESEKKLEHTKLNLLRINDILTEIEGNLEPLKQQADKARKFLDLKQELKNIEVGLFVYNIEKYKKDIEKVSEDIEIITSNCNLEEGKLEKLKILKEELKENIDEITNKIESMQNIGFESQKKQEQLNSDINVYKSKIENNEQNEKRYLDEIEELKTKINTSEEEMNLKLDKKTSLKQNKERFEKELEEKQNELNTILATFSEKELKIEEAKRKLEANTDKKYELEADINAQNANINNIEKRDKQIDSEISNNISDKDRAKFDKEDIQKEYYEAQKSKTQVEDELSNVRKNKQEKEKKIKEYDIKINNLTQELQLKQSRHKFLVETENEKEGYIRSVKSLLKDCQNIKELGKGMNGALAELIEVPDEYQTAIEMTLGASLQNIVTENEQDAKRLIEHLRKNNLGRASFLPLTSVKGKKLDNIKGKSNGFIGIASDLINFNKKYEPIILSLLGRTVIVENMDTAIDLAKKNGYSFRIVTLEGDLINPSGAMAGGSVAKKTVNILGRSKEIEKLALQIKKIIEEIENLKKSKQEILDGSEEIFKKEKELEDKLKEAEIKYNVELQKQQSIDQYISKIDNTIQKLKNEKETLKIEKDETLKNINTNNESVKKIEELNLELQDLINKFADSNKDTQKRVDDLNFDITNLKISVSSFDESENSIEEITKMMKQEIENGKNSIEIKNKQIENLKNESIELNSKIEESLSKIEEIKNEVENSSSNIEKLKQDRIKANERLTQKENEQAEEFKIIEDLKAQLVKLDVKKNKLDEDLNTQVNALWEEYELTPNATGEYQKPENVSVTQKRVNNLHADIRDLGSINVNSIDEYNTLKNRYDFMCEQRLDLENTMSKLNKMIADITITMKEQFKEKFEVINQNFGEVFSELFGGGKATISLEDENNVLECGININVQPPGKKLQNMLLLSGGERAFTAIALLFAILKMNPAPFCVLDEIEAALDDVNVYRYADFLKKFSMDTQFLLITHRKGTMEAADTVYGVTMEEHGISKLLSIKLK